MTLPAISTEASDMIDSWGSDNSASRMLSDLERGNEDPNIKK
jgi:hypothetical protein